jgi:CRP/FNR family transcriptional regulator
MRRFAELASDLAFREVTERVARYLEATARADDRAVATATTFELALTQEQLAARLGTVRELVARSFAQLRSSHVVAQRGRRVTILDPARLTALARGETRLDRHGVRPARL